MPCYDYTDNNVRTEYVNGVDPIVYQKRISELIDKVCWLEAGLCAIITELEKKNIANEVISQASKSGLIDLMSFWEQHSKEDEARLANKFHSFSEHEQSMIRKMITNGKL